MLPIGTLSDHGIERHQHFAYDRGERDLAQAVVVVDQVSIERFHDGVELDGAVSAVKEHLVPPGQPWPMAARRRCLPLSRLCGARPQKRGNLLAQARAGRRSKSRRWQDLRRRAANAG